MESGNSCFTPCLIDELMDQGVVKVDINLGVNSEEVADFADQKKASPSHESDSGFSNMTSPSYSVSSSDDMESVTGNDAPNYGIFSDLLDNEFVNYLCGDDVQESENCNTEPVLSVGSVLTQTPDVDSDSENNNSNLSYFDMDLKPSRSSSRIDVYQSNQSTSLKENREVNKPPTVKVIRVIKSAPTKTDTEKEIYDAFEDRNRKNAIQAKMNREKKKQYIKSLEDQVDELKSENNELKGNKEKLQKSKEALEEEVAYLKSVLANQSSLSKLLKNIPNVSNVKLSSSFMQRKRSAELDHDYQNSSKRSRRSSTAGVCLHVDKDQVSLEFCSKCSSLSKQEV